MKRLVWAALGLAACGGNVTANPCLTRGATYLVSFQEESGNCGPVPSTVVNVNPDGTVPDTSGMTCASESLSGCTVRKSDCHWTSQGFAYTSTSSITIAPDGSSGTGLATISANGNGANCAETYGLTYARQ